MPCRKNALGRLRHQWKHINVAHEASRAAALIACYLDNDNRLDSARLLDATAVSSARGGGGGCVG